MKSGWYYRLCEQTYRNKWHFFDNDQPASVCGMLVIDRYDRMAREPDKTTIPVNPKDKCKACKRMVSQ